MQSRVHYGLLVIAALFACGFVANMIQGDAQPGDTPFQLAAVALCIGAFLFVHRGERRRTEFLQFLVANRDAVRAGTASYRGHKVTYATRVHTPHIVLGFLLVSFRLPLRPVFMDERATGLRLGACATCLVFGWWGLRAIVWNLATLANNVRSKPVISVGELMEGGPVVDVPSARAS